MTEGIAVTLVFIDSTQGWLVTDDGLQSEVSTGPEYIRYSNWWKLLQQCGTNFKSSYIYRHQVPFVFLVQETQAGSTLVDYLVVAGGGGGGHWYGAGAGAGGYRFSDGTASGSYAAGPSPLGASAAPVTSVIFSNNSWRWWNRRYLFSSGKRYKWWCFNFFNNNISWRWWIWTLIYFRTTWWCRWWCRW
jgi:hypothetical protein